MEHKFLKTTKEKRLGFFHTYEVEVPVGWEERGETSYWKECWSCNKNFSIGRWEDTGESFYYCKQCLRYY